MIFLAVLNGQPRELGLDQAIRCFIDHRIDVVQRRTVFLLRKAREREHILEGLQDCARQPRYGHQHHPRLGFARRGARESVCLGQGNRDCHQPRPRAAAARGKRPHAAPDRRHSRTATLPAHAALHRRAAQRTRARFARRSPSTNRSWPARRKLRAVIVKELEEVRDKYGDARRTQIIDESAELQLEDLIADEQVRRHGEPPGLPEAHAHQHLSPAAPRRHRGAWA